MKAIRLQIVMPCMLVFLFCAPAVGQQSATTQPLSAYEAFDLLKNGTLVVRLTTNAKKIEALEKKLASNPSEKDRQQFEKMLEKTKQDTRRQNLWLMEAFRANYTFSKLLFMPDTAAAKLKNGIKKGIFYGSDLQIDPAISFAGNFLVAFNGKSTSDQKSGNEGIHVLDEQMELLSSPFPFFTGRTSIRRMFEEVFNKSTDLDHYNKLVAKFQIKLQEFGG